MKSRESHLISKAEVYELIKAALAELGRADEPYSYGAAHDQETQQQIIYFDLPRISQLQFNIYVKTNAKRPQNIEQLRSAITERLEVD